MSFLISYLKVNKKVVANLYQESTLNNYAFPLTTCSKCRFSVCEYSTLILSFMIPKSLVQLVKGREVRKVGRVREVMKAIMFSLRVMFKRNGGRVVV